MTDFRVGQGFDVHALVPGRKLVLGGIEIPFERGLLVTPTRTCCCTPSPMRCWELQRWATSARCFRTLRSSIAVPTAALLREVARRVRDAGWRVGNIDATVIAERPKIAPHVEAMREAIAECTGVERLAISVKGKTMEKLGALGRGEGIAAQAVVLLVRS